MMSDDNFRTDVLTRAGAAAPAIVEQGTHDELVAARGCYWRLVSNQLELGN